MRARWLLMVCAVLFLAGCRVDNTTTVTMQPDGTGTVAVQLVLDAEAVTIVEAGDAKLEDRIVLTDLASAGWQLDAWVRRPDGSAARTVTKRFSRPDRIEGIFAEVYGAQGAVQNVRASFDRRVVGPKWEMHARINLPSAQTGVTTDTELRDRIVGAGLSPDAADALLAKAMRNGVSVSVRVQLPNRASQTWQGSWDRVVRVDATSSAWHWARLALVAGGALAVLAGVTLFVIGERRRARRQPLRPPSRRSSGAQPGRQPNPNAQ